MVDGGAGDGSYKPGTFVNLRARVPSNGKVFDRWVITGGAPGLSNPESPVAVLTMPDSSASVMASYKDQSTAPYEFKNVGGYQGPVTSNFVPDPYFGGFSMYVAAWPFQQNYPGSASQTGLYGTWLSPGGPGTAYNTIEGGLGWWGDTRFATETPKFIMGGVSNYFYAIANGPGAGAGSWSEPRGKYGVAQLSPWLLWPPDGVNVRQGASGELFGYGYLPLPLTEAKSVTAGVNVPTGNHSWTLFLNTENFKGPVAFFLPYFWSEAAVRDPSQAGLSFDTQLAARGAPISMETQWTPAIEAISSNGRAYARIAPLLFPADAGDTSVLVNGLNYYDKGALWDRVDAWLKGGAPATGTIDTARMFRMTFTAHSDTWAIWQDQPSPVTGQRDTPIPWRSIGRAATNDPYSLVLDWNRRHVQKVQVRGNEYNLFPEYFKLNARTQTWRPVGAAQVPADTALQRHTFTTTRRTNEPYTTPDAPNSPWKSPGPVAGPFYAYPGDGSRITYFWYRFADQPAMLNADLTPAEREAVQKRVEAIHRSWKRDGTYLPAPTVAKPLAAIDPALIVEPPAGFEVGYVPIATRQEAANR